MKIESNSTSPCKRSPKRSPGSQAEAQARWRLKNPEAYVRGYRRANRDHQRKVILKRLGFLASHRRREVLALHERGKSLADIVIWTRIPMSIVQKMITGHQPAGKATVAV